MGITQARDANGNLQTLKGLDRLRDYEGGVDLKYGLTSALTLDATYNTDFAQVEVDQQQVNLTRFNLFFPEKRDFFLENSGIFNFGPGGNLVPFFSRRIGLSSSGTPIPIIGGALAAALWFTEPEATPAYSGTVGDEEALTIVKTRCSSCHAQMPSDATIKTAPKGIALETLDELKRYAQQIEIQAVKNRAMPLGNKTGMVAEERAKLGAWIDAQ
jgi:hypothetical protein